MRFIKKHIKPGNRVLEIGAATGRYSHAPARQGYAVDAVELVEPHIEIFEQNSLSNETITITQGNAMADYRRNDIAFEPIFYRKRKC